MAKDTKDHEKISKKSGVSRRDFLKGGALIAAGALAAESLIGCTPKDEGSGAGNSSAGVGTVLDSGYSYEVYDTDILILGAGLSGKNAALEATARGANVIVVDKGPFGHSGGSGFNWDIVTVHIDDPDVALPLGIASYGGLLDQTLAKSIIDLQVEVDIRSRIGNGGTTIYTRNPDGTLFSFPFGTAGTATRGTFPRHDADIIAAQGITVFDQTMITNIIVVDGACLGAVGLHLPTGTVRVFRSKSTIACSCGGAWATGWLTVSAETVNSPDNTGDLLSIALRKGCTLQNMEMAGKDLIMTYPTGIAFSYNGAIGSEPLWKDNICDKDGDFWMQGRELSRLEFMIEVAQRVNEGKGGPNGGVFLDLRDVDGKESPWIATLTEYYARNINPLKEKFGVDVHKDMLEVKPEQADTFGGIVTDENLETEIDGLFFNNTAQGFVSSSVVMIGGMLAARNAVKHAADSNIMFDDKAWAEVTAEYDRLYDILNKEVSDPLRPHEVRQLIQKTMGENMGPIREGSKIQTCIDELARIRKEELPRMTVQYKTKAFNVEWKEALENLSLLDFAETSSLASLTRTESRWELVRVDCLERDDENWLCKLGVKLDGDKLSIRKLENDFSVYSEEDVKDFLAMLKDA